jgi:hypothetical protein
MVSAIAVVMTVIVELPLSLAFLVWLGSFLLDSCYTYLNRQYIQRYELNMIVRRSKRILLGFIKVAMIESAMIILFGMVFWVMGYGYTNNTNADIGIDTNTIAYSTSFMLFSSIHVMAFVRSYLFLHRKR